MERLTPGYKGGVMSNAPNFVNDEVLQSWLVATPCSLSVSWLTGSIIKGLRVARFRTNSAVVVPSAASIAACASADVYSAATNSFDLAASKAPGCYPLCTAVYLSIRKSGCDMATDAARTAAVQLVEWIFDGSKLDAAVTQQRMAPLYAVSPAVETSTLAGLDLVTCTPKVLGSGFCGHTARVAAPSTAVVFLSVAAGVTVAAPRRSWGCGGAVCDCLR